MSQTLTFNSIANSNLPVAEKTAMMRAYERITGNDLPSNLAKKFHMVKGAGLEGLETVRAYGEGAIGGAILGLIATDGGGLDRTIRGQRVPLDGAGALIFGAGAMALGAMGSPLATESRNLGTACTSVLSFRKIQDYRKSASGVKVHGDVDDFGADGGDPIINAARHI